MAEKAIRERILQDIDRFRWLLLLNGGREGDPGEDTARTPLDEENENGSHVAEKAIREENERYFFWQNGKLVTLTLSSPYGADNADQWNLMSKSFRWQ